MLKRNSFTNVVTLQKDASGILRAFPVSNVSIIGNRAYSIKNATHRFYSRVLVLRRPYRHKHPAVMSYATMPEKKPQQLTPIPRLDESTITVRVTNSLSAKNLYKVLYILLTAGGLFFIAKSVLVPLYSYCTEAKLSQDQKEEGPLS